MPQGGNFDWGCSGHRIKAYHTIWQLWGNLGIPMAGGPAQSEPGVIRLALNRGIRRILGTARVGFSGWDVDSVWLYAASGKYAGELKVVHRESAT